MVLIDRCNLVERLFNQLIVTSGKTEKHLLVKQFKDEWPELVEDLDFCFEVLAGKHKLGYTFIIFDKPTNIDLHDLTIKELVNRLKAYSSSYDNIVIAGMMVPKEARKFIAGLVNRDYRLGYSNRNNMITSLSPMLAKKYPETFMPGQYYYIQEKLDGNRCIAYYDFIGDMAGKYNNPKDAWHFQSRSGKPLKVCFDMSWADPELVYDGEIMTLAHAGTRDFNRTSGAINGKYTDKSQLHYFVYDIVNEDLMYKERKAILDSYNQEPSDDCSILPVLAEVYLNSNLEYNWQLDDWLDKIVDKGGEGLILRDPDGYYQCGKRSNGLLKYKKTQTMDLRITDWNEGNGKYEGAIGSFLCQTDDGSIRVNVSGMPDDIHFSDPAQWIGRIIEVAYFYISQSSANNYKSLRFPRLKRIRDDKNETSIY